MIFLYGLVAEFVVWLASVIGKKAAVAVTVGATFVAGTLALQALLFGLWMGLAYSLPAVMRDGLGFVVYLLPSNFSTCIAAMMGGKIARWLWDSQVEWLKVSALA